MDFGPLLIILMFVIVIGYYVYDKIKRNAQKIIPYKVPMQRVEMKVLYGDKQKKYKRQ